MKKLIVLALAACTLCANAQDFPKPSPLAKTYQRVGLTDVEIEYSSPAVKERKVFGEVVKLNELWRTGANSATVLSFSENVTFGDADVPAGEYALFSIPGEDKIQFFLNTNTDQGGTGSYDPKLTIGSATVDLSKTKTNVERLRFTIENTTANGADLVMSWANRTAVIPMKMSTSSQAETRMKEKMVAMTEDEFDLYSGAASYYLEEGDARSAVEWAQKSVEMREKFWNTHTLAKAYKLNGENDKALKMAQQSLMLSQKAEYQPYVEMNQKLIAELEK